MKKDWEKDAQKGECWDRQKGQILGGGTEESLEVPWVSGQSQT